MKNDKDDDPILIDTTLTVTDTKWNPSGNFAYLFNISVLVCIF
jgi:hypothetical protein